MLMKFFKRKNHNSVDFGKVFRFCKQNENQYLVLKETRESLEEKFLSVDPTEDKKYLSWILKIYFDHQFSIADLPELKKHILQYHQYEIISRFDINKLTYKEFLEESFQFKRMIDHLFPNKLDDPKRIFDKVEILKKNSQGDLFFKIIPDVDSYHVWCDGTKIESKIFLFMLKSRFHQSAHLYIFLHNGQKYLLFYDTADYGSLLVIDENNKTLQNNFIQQNWDFLKNFFNEVVLEFKCIEAFYFIPVQYLTSDFCRHVIDVCFDFKKNGMIWHNRYNCRKFIQYIEPILDYSLYQYAVNANKDFLEYEQIDFKEKYYHDYFMENLQKINNIPDRYVSEEMMLISLYHNYEGTAHFLHGLPIHHPIMNIPFFLKAIEINPMIFDIIPMEYTQNLLKDFIKITAMKKWFSQKNSLCGKNMALLMMLKQKVDVINTHFLRSEIEEMIFKFYDKEVSILILRKSVFDFLNENARIEKWKKNPFKR